MLVLGYSRKSTEGAPHQKGNAYWVPHAKHSAMIWMITTYYVFYMFIVTITYAVQL